MAVSTHNNTSTNINTAPMYDLFIVGGGINGTGIAADASQRGFSVALCEQSDLASATSSASSKLIHGGLRYLEHYEFRLVRESLAEREILLNKAPHLIKQQRFIVPHSPHLRPAWMIRAGLFLYDHLSTRNKLPGSRELKLDTIDGPLQSQYHKGFEYFDCWADDARLVLENALAAQQTGADIFVQTCCIRARQVEGIWHITTQRQVADNTVQTHHRAKVLINAAGPWVQSFIEQNLNLPSPRNSRLIKGSHIVIPKLYDGDQAYLLQNEDQRVVFVIPFGIQYTLIGTTDEEYQGDPRQVRISEQEKTYLLDVLNRYFKSTTTLTDIIWQYSGVRPLCDDESGDPSAITRDYTLELQANENQHSAPLLSVFGGKLTTYRRLSEASIDKLKPFFPEIPTGTTAFHALPGGDIGGIPFANWLEKIHNQYAWLSASLLERLANAYGARLHQVLVHCHSMDGLGLHFGADLYQAEVDYMMQQEWATCADDILWRRSKLGLIFSAEETICLNEYMKNNMSALLHGQS